VARINEGMNFIDVGFTSLYGKPRWFAR